MPSSKPSDRHIDAADALGVSRRTAIQYVTMILGGTALVGGSTLLTSDAAARQVAADEGVGTFTTGDIRFLDEIAETILPETGTPGARAARTGAFMALMVTNTYTERNQQVFRDGMVALEDASRRMHGAGFLQATPSQRLALLEVVDREQHAAMRERAPDSPPHYFRLMKELALLGYFTSEIGYTQAMRYVESPGRFDPCVPYAAGEQAWAPHA